MGASQRIKAVDILRGLTVACMVMVNNSGGHDTYESLKHSVWNGITPCDFVFPFFLFIVGVSLALSLGRSGYSFSSSVAAKTVKRTVKMFLLGLALHYLGKAMNGDFLCFDQLRIWGVLQRIALSYCMASFLVMWLKGREVMKVSVALLLVYAVILLLFDGYAQDSTNILSRVDVALVGTAHLYHKSPVDPEGLLGIIPSVAHVLIGFKIGCYVRENEELTVRLCRIFSMGVILIALGYIISYGLPFNKRIWSPSFVLVTTGAASALLSTMAFLSRDNQDALWTRPWITFGMNPLFLYVLSEVLETVIGALGIKPGIYAAIVAVFSDTYLSSLIYAILFVAVIYLVGLILERKKIFIKI